MTAAHTNAPPQLELGRSLLVGFASAIVNVGGVVWVGVGSGPRPYLASMFTFVSDSALLVGYIFALAFAIGALLGLAGGRQHYVATSVGALLALSLLLVPVAAVNFFALLVAPWLLVYAVVVGLGTRLVGRRRVVPAARMPPADVAS